MSIMNLGDWKAGINKYTCHCLWATMCFPDELSSRQQYLNKKTIELRGDMKDRVVGNASGVQLESIGNPFEQAAIEIKVEEMLLAHIEQSINKGFEKYYLHSGGDQVTVKASSQDQMRDTIEKSFLYKGITAGLVLFKIHQLKHHYEGGGSINKAFYLIEKFYKGTKIPQSRESIKNAWHDFKSVSPYWAAAVYLFGEFRGENGFGLIEWFESDIPNNLLRFLQYAEYFKNFGEQHLPNIATKKPTLNSQESWVLPDKFPARGNIDFEVLELQEWELEAMSKYKAPSNSL